MVEFFLDRGVRLVRDEIYPPAEDAARDGAYRSIFFFVGHDLRRFDRSVVPGRYLQVPVGYPCSVPAWSSPGAKKDRPHEVPSWVVVPSPWEIEAAFERRRREIESTQVPMMGRDALLRAPTVVAERQVSRAEWERYTGAPLPSASDAIREDGDAYRAASKGRMAWDSASWRASYCGLSVEDFARLLEER